MLSVRRGRSRYPIPRSQARPPLPFFEGVLIRIGPRTAGAAIHALRRPWFYLTESPMERHDKLMAAEGTTAHELTPIYCSILVTN